MTAFDGKRQNLQTSFFIFFIFAKIRPVRTKNIDRRTDRQTHTETDKSIAIGDILQICLQITEEGGQRGW